MDIFQLLQSLGNYFLKAFLAYASLCLVFPIGAAYQEYKLWKPKGLPSLSLYGLIKVYLFNVLWTGFCLLGAVIIFPKWLITGHVEHEATAIVERQVARLCVLAMVGPVEVRGRENLPPDNPGAPAPVYIANHASQIDVAVVYYLWREFKWVAKISVLLMPGVGPIMYLANHVFIQRKGKNKSSIHMLYDKSNKAVQSGLPMFFFPQGTRRMAEKLEFKHGAFNVAMHNKSSLVPVSIEIPLDAWNRLYPLSLLWGEKSKPVILTVHKMVPVTGNEDKEALMKQCRDTIYSVLPPVPGSDARNQKGWLNGWSISSQTCVKVGEPALPLLGFAIFTCL